MNRREFLGESLAACALTAGPRQGILNYNPRMEYRRLGKTGLMVSAICLGGHWKRVATAVPGLQNATGYSEEDLQNIRNSEFQNNRHTILSHCAEVGVNYVDACSPPEILAYSRALKGRRDKMYLGFSWHEREPRYPEWRTARRLMEGFDMSLKEAGLDYVDLWRISLPMDGSPDLDLLRRVEEATTGALEQAKRQGKARFTGVSSHNRVWLKWMIEQYPKQIEVVLFPYTANTAELPDHSIFETIKAHNAGVFGIKPFADNSLFQGDSSLASPVREADDRRARLALRYILGNPAITAPIPGLINIPQVDNAVRAVNERRRLDLKEKAELEDASKRMWANLRPGYEWLRDWQYV